MKKSIECEKKQNSIFSIYDPLGVKLLTRLRLQYSHLNEHKFRYGLGDAINAVCACASKVETTKYFLLSFRLFFSTETRTFENLEKVDSSLLNLNVSFLLYGPQSATSQSFNPEVLKFLLNYIEESGRFDRLLFCPN